jgi:phage-related protein
MADIGFQISGTGITTAVIRPDNDLTKSSKPKVKISRFGDGYEQRAKPGINHIAEKYKITLKNREKSVADDIIKFFNDKGGISSFDFTLPDSNSSTNDSYGNTVSTIKVVCDSWNLQYSNASNYNVSAMFRKIHGV